MRKRLLILAALASAHSMSVVHAESVQKNYVNWCSDPGSGGCPVARVPYMTPKSTQLMPHPIPQLVPQQVLPEQKVPGFAKTVGRPGEVTVVEQPKEIKMTKIEKIDTKIKKTKAKIKALKQIERLVDVTNRVQARIENESNSVRGVQHKANNFDFVLGGLAVAGALAVKRRNNG